MAKYKNSLNISVGRSLNIPTPADDRLIYSTVDDVILDSDFNSGVPYKWYDGMIIYILDTHAQYAFLDANEGNVNVDYTQNLLVNTVDYPIWVPIYGNRKFNFYPFITGGSGTGIYSNDNPTSASNLEGWPIGTIPGQQSLQYMWDTLLYPYTPPLISLTSDDTPGYYEKGFVLLHVNLVSTTTKKKLPIISVETFRGVSSINLDTDVNPNGGVEAYYYDTPIGVDSNPSDVSFVSKVSDGQSIVTSNTIWYRFVYPFYVGSLTTIEPNEAQVKGLNKLTVPKQNIAHEFNFTQERYIFAYPQSYGVLKNILDNNLFETIGDYNVLSKTFTMLDGAVVPYYVYVFNPYNSGLLTDAVDFTNTFKF